MAPEADDLILKWQKVFLKKKILRRRWLVLSLFIPIVLISFQNCEPTSVKINKAKALAHD